MKFPKTIRFDNSDLNIFENPSEEGEWAISGAFEFSNDTKENLKEKENKAFQMVSLVWIPLEDQLSFQLQVLMILKKE